LQKAGAVVLGVSRDTLASHGKFRAKYDLPFDLLSDPDNALAKRYGAFGKKMMYGREVEGTIRSTFLIDESGQIAARWSPVRVAGHTAQVLDALGADGAPARPPSAARKKPAAKKPVTKKAAAKKGAAKKPSAVKSASKKTKTKRAASKRPSRA
jgi:peroxiredoxin Q/BCP